jgi:hypothetical protein
MNFVMPAGHVLADVSADRRWRRANSHRGYQVHWCCNRQFACAVNDIRPFILIQAYRKRSEGVMSLKALSLSVDEASPSAIVSVKQQTDSRGSVGLWLGFGC